MEKAQRMSKWEIPELKENYIKLHLMLEAKHIKEVFVQYPTQELNNLTRFFSPTESKGIIFVGNEEDYKLAQDPKNYEKYFTDEVFTGFGHQTPLGNKTLASQIANEILKNIH